MAATLEFRSKFRVQRLSLEPCHLLAYYGLDGTDSDVISTDEKITLRRSSRLAKSIKKKLDKPTPMELSPLVEYDGGDNSSVQFIAEQKLPARKIAHRRRAIQLEEADDSSVHSANISSKSRRRRRVDNRSFYQRLDLGAVSDGDKDGVLKIASPTIATTSKAKPTSAKRTRTRTDHNANNTATNEPPVLRRSARNRVKRLDPSVNQRAVYTYENGVPSLVGITEVTIRKCDRKKYAHYANFVSK